MKTYFLQENETDFSNQKKAKNNYLSDLCDTFSLLDLTSQIKHVKSLKETSTDVMLTNRPKGFHHRSLVETCLSDCHRMIVLFSGPVSSDFQQKL